MRTHLIAAIVMTVLCLLPGSVRSAEARSFFQLCLARDDNPSYTLFLNFNVQGNSILVSGRRSVGPPDDGGPVFGSLVPMLQHGFWEMGLTLTYGNMGDYQGPSVQHLVFLFGPTTIAYRLSTGGSPTFVQGTAHLIACPGSF